jgi:hypothetical protein
MTEHHTFPGKTYCITCAEGCTVTDASGQLNAECEAGKQLWVTAPSEKLFTSAPASVRETFNSAPVKLKLLGLLGGGVSTLPSGYLSAEFLYNKGENYFLLDMPVNNEMGLSYEMINISVANGFPISWQQESPFKCFRIANNWSGANGSVTWWGTTLSSILNPNGTKVLYECNFKNSRKLRVSSAVAETKEAAINEFSCDYNKVSFGKILEYKGSSVLTHDWAKIKIFDIKLTSGETFVYDLTPAIDANGKACLYDKVSKKPYYGETASALIVGMTLEQARKLGKLPKTGGTLKVSLPSNYLEDEGVTNAVAAANAKGWNIVVDSTFEADGASATFALRRIWVRKTQDEQGNYIDSDGVRWLVESCVAMYNADGSEPDAHGYEPFRSVDVATEYWGLTPWVDPEQEGLLTNTDEV